MKFSYSINHRSIGFCSNINVHCSCYSTCVDCVFKSQAQLCGDLTYIPVLQGVMKLERQQILSLFIKVIKKVYKYLYAIASEEIQSNLPQPKVVSRAN